MCTSSIGAVHAAGDGWNPAAKGTQSSYTTLAYHFEIDYRLPAAVLETITTGSATKRRSFIMMIRIFL
jgi:hypothetical protein